MLAISQSDLSRPLKISFQQIQKHEKGVNRVSASRLLHIAHILKVPVSFFFEDLSPDEPAGKNAKSIAPILDINELMASRGYSGDGGQAFHLKADSGSGRSRTAFR
jgi:transcriptional regulator with XRE-family HTH domain